MKILHIHIGTAKTATTAIQSFCGENARVLKKKGYCYPTFPFQYPGKSLWHNGSFLLTAIRNPDGKRNKEQERKNFFKGMKKIRRLFFFYDHVVLSDEGIWRGMDMERKGIWEMLLSEAEKGGFCLHVIVYLRRQDAYYLSHWNQRIKKKGAQETVDAYFKKIDPFRGDYYGKLSRLSELIGKENITVRRFENGKFEGGSIFSDFLYAIGLSMTEEYRIPDEVRNPGLYGNMVEFKRVLNSAPQMKDPELSLFIVKILWECAKLSKRDYQYDFCSEEEAEAFLEPYLPGNRRVAQEFLDEPEGELFAFEPSNLPKWQKDNPYMMDDLIRFAGEAVICLYEQNRELKREFEERI